MKVKNIIILCLAGLLFSSMLCFGAEDMYGRIDLDPARWKNIYEKDGIKVYSQEVADSPILALRATGILNAGVSQVMEVLRKVDIAMEWMPDVSEKMTVRDYSDYEAVTYSVNDFPWPIADREMMLHNRLRLDRENKFLVVEVFSVDTPPYPSKQDAVRAYMHYGETRLRPLGKDRTQVELTIFVDPRGDIPAWMVNLFQKTLPYNFLSSLEKKARKTHYPLRPNFQKILDELRSLLASTPQDTEKVKSGE